MALVAVCSNRPRPSVQKGAKGHQWWKRDVYHISDGHNFTLCGRAHHDWLTVGEIAEPDADCCQRCAKASPAISKQIEGE